MISLKQVLEICQKLDVDTAKIKIGKDEYQKIEKQAKEIAIKRLMNQKNPG